MNNRVFQNRFFHNQISDILRFIFRSQEIGAIGDIFEPKWRRTDIIKRQFFEVPHIYYTYILPQGMLLNDQRRRSVFFEKLREFIWMKRRWDPIYLKRKIFIDPESEVKEFNMESDRMIHRLADQMLFVFEKDIIKGIIDRTARSKGEKAVEMKKLQRGDTMLVLTEKGKDAILHGVPLSEIIDKGFEQGMLQTVSAKIRRSAGEIPDLEGAMTDAENQTLLQTMSGKTLEPVILRNRDEQQALGEAANDPFVDQNGRALIDIFQSAGIDLQNIISEGNVIHAEYEQNGIHYEMEYDLETGSVNRKTAGKTLIETDIDELPQELQEESTVRIIQEGEFSPLEGMEIETTDSHQGLRDLPASTMDDTGRTTRVAEREIDENMLSEEESFSHGRATEIETQTALEAKRMREKERKSLGRGEPEGGKEEKRGQMPQKSQEQEQETKKPRRKKERNVAWIAYGASLGSIIFPFLGS